MKKFSSLLVLAVSFLSITANAGAWPTRLADLEPAALAQIANHARGADLNNYGLIAFRPTVGNHGIATYEALGPEVTCEHGFRAGEVDRDRLYIDLYVEGSQINHITTYANYSCPQD